MTETKRLDTFDFDRGGDCERDDLGLGDWMRTDDVRALFTREDVEAVRSAAKHLHHFGLATLADRLAALLPE